METHPDDTHTALRRERQSSFWSSPSSWVALGFVGVVGYFLVAEHAAHLASILPWLLIAACPLMHLFMHQGGHGGHDHSGGTARPPVDKAAGGQAMTPVLGFNPRLGAPGGRAHA
jgi:hypothetical protein